MNELTLHSITPVDYNFLFQLYASTRSKEMNAVDWPPEQIQDFLRMQFKLQDHHYRTIYPQAALQIVRLAGNPIGKLYVEHNAQRIHIIDIALLPEWQHKGIGKRLIQSLIRESEEKQLILSLHVEINNPIREYYLRLGFCDCGTRGIYNLMERKPGVLAG
jgi:ribosomal protein S18 acetylase RimI-like enzyme